MRRMPSSLPSRQRPQSDGGKIGILHVKCAVADGRWLFLSSANLTEYAFTINMELGLLVTGGSLPKQIEERFLHLCRGGSLLPLQTSENAREDASSR